MQVFVGDYFKTVLQQELNWVIREFWPKGMIWSVFFVILELKMQTTYFWIVMLLLQSVVKSLSCPKLHMWKRRGHSKTILRNFMLLPTLNFIWIYFVSFGYLFVGICEYTPMLYNYAINWLILICQFISETRNNT